MRNMRWTAHFSFKGAFGDLQAVHNISNKMLNAIHTKVCFKVKNCTVN